MLTLIAGTNLKQKIDYLNNITLANLQTGKKVIYIVPEQYTLVYEKNLLHVIDEGLINLEILNFTRLYDYALKYCFYREKKFIDTRGEKVLMSKAIEQTKDSLKTYKNIDNISFINKILKLEKELSSYCVNVEDIGEKAREIENIKIREKITDIALIISVYKALLENAGFSKKTLLEELVDILSENNFLQNTCVIIDGFHSFTKAQYSVIKEIMKKCSDTIITVHTDTFKDTSGGYGLFSKSIETANYLKDNAQNEGIDINEILPEYENNNDEISFIANNIFRNSNKYKEKATNINIYTAKDMYDECEFLACQISKLILEEKADYRDIAIIGRDVEGYIGILDFVLDRYNIPYFLDDKGDILSKPLALYIITLLSISVYKLDRESLITMLKTGLCDIENGDIYKLEKYLNKWNIKQQELNNGKSFTKYETDEEKEELSHLSQLKARIVEPIQKFCNSLKDKTATEMVEILIDHLKSCKIDQKIANLCEIYFNKAEYALAQENKQIWNEIVKAIGQISTSLERDKISVKKFKELLEYILLDTKLFKLPTSLNEVIIGNIDRTRIMPPKYVFVIGLNDGVFPKISTDDALISEIEKKELSSFGIEFFEKENLDIFDERFLAYLAFTMPTKFLFLSYAKIAKDGKEAFKSFFLKQIEEAFVAPSFIYFEDVELIEKIYRSEPSLNLLAVMQNDKNKLPEINALYTYFSDILGSDNLEKIINFSNLAKKEEIKNTKLIEQTYPKTLKISPSRAENYFKCRYLYFCKYALGLKENLKNSFDSMQIGTFIHYAMERAFLYIENNKLDIKTISNEQIDIISKHISEEYLREYLHSQEQTPRFLYIYNKLSKTISKLLKSIAKEFSQSDFVTTAVEVEIGTNKIPSIEIELENNRTITLSGIIDRVDTLEKNKKKYLRIIDYKTGAKEFSLADINNGINLQLLIYLFSLCKGNTELLPAGALYYKAKDKTVSVSREDIKQANFSEQEKTNRMSGLILNDREVVEAMEKDLKGKYIPVKETSKGLTTKNLVTLEQFGKLKKHIEKLLADMGNSLYKGDISINPYKDKKLNSCAYCPYTAVCGYEKGNGTPRKYDDTSPDDFWQIIETEGEN